MRTSLLTPALLSLLASTDLASGLRIATSLQWIEHTPQPYAIKHFYNGSSTAQLISGGVQSLSSDKSIDLAANAETQGLLTYASHRDVRLIYVICEVAYRLVADGSKGIKTLADLKGKKVGSMKGTSAGYFVSKLLGTAGLADRDYTIVSGNVCMKAPCGAGTFPAMIKQGQVDAFGIWEPAVELGAQALGADRAVMFGGDPKIYREVYSLYTTDAKLADPATRKDIVAFVEALNKTLDVFTNKPETVYADVAAAVGMDVDVVKAVWPVHKWTGRWGDDMLDFITQEQTWLAGQNRQQAISSADLAKFLDSDILDAL
ncbi:periplasmic binding protein-like II [Phialemonium atrogriseum]|uniref:Periplasmic binding protein-like II n=1 Tax=Phialemonium atrogriseum TaxID=1093897 RepID=A0AAJ0BQ55_9PEZI|nr:periplasmic binding protein-like II [Phialemonium atrogriseum]KAK1762175.1 periplasmic binding protein-like II [Phialemonium atrogriseum]